MQLVECWIRFRSGFSEVVYLTRAARKAPALIIPGATVSEQQTLVRAGIVLLASHVEAFFSEMADEYIDSIDDRSFAAQPPAIQRYLALQAAEELSTAITTVGDAYEPSKRANFYAATLRASRWMKSPARVAHASKPKLQGFYRQKGVAAIEKYLRLYCSRNIKFFDWLGSLGLDRGRYVTVVEGLITARNEIAHGSDGSSLSVQDLRDYLAVVTVMVRRVRNYIE